MVRYGGHVSAASTPNAAGHRGSHLRLEEVLEMHAADQPPDEPPQRNHPARLSSAGDAVHPLWMLVAALAFAAITAFFVLVRV
jgi:hypothetical protein